MKVKEPMVGSRPHMVIEPEEPRKARGGVWVQATVIFGIAAVLVIAMLPFVLPVALFAMTVVTAVAIEVGALVGWLNRQLFGQPQGSGRIAGPRIS